MICHCFHVAISFNRPLGEISESCDYIRPLACTQYIIRGESGDSIGARTCVHVKHWNLLGARCVSHDEILP